MKLVIFDLDGTLTPQRPGSAAAFERRLLDGIADGCTRLRAAGLNLAIASNQGGILKGLPLADVQDHVSWVCASLDIAAYRIAYEPERKKPNPAMLHELMTQFGVEPLETCLVGDSVDDRLAAAAAGVRFIHVEDFLAKGIC